MQMKDEIVLPAGREQVWHALNDVDVLRACIPGCQSLEATEEGGFAAVVKVKVGPIGVTMKGTVTLSDLDPPNGYRISGAGDGGVAGLAKGGAVVALTPEGEGTRLTYEVDAAVSGKLAQLGARLIDGVAKRLSAQFFEKFAEIVQNGGPARA